MAEQAHGPTQHHQPEKAGNPDTKGMLSGNKKWYLVGALAAIAVLVFAFVRKSNSNAATSSTPTSSTLDPTTLAMLQAALQGQANGSSTGLPGAQGPPGATGPAGPAGPPGQSTGTSTGGPVTVNIPNEGGWLPVTFPNASALQAFYQFAGVTANNGYYPSNGDVNRTAWETELQQLGATGYPAPPSMSASPAASVPHTAQ